MAEAQGGDAPTDVPQYLINLEAGKPVSGDVKNFLRQRVNSSGKKGVSVKQHGGYAVLVTGHIEHDLLEKYMDSMTRRSESTNKSRNPWTYSIKKVEDGNPKIEPPVKEDGHTGSADKLMRALKERETEIGYLQSELGEEKERLKELNEENKRLAAAVDRYEKEFPKSTGTPDFESAVAAMLSSQSSSLKSVEEALKKAGVDPEDLTKILEASGKSFRDYTKEILGVQIEESEAESPPSDFEAVLRGKGILENYERAASTMDYRNKILEGETDIPPNLKDTVLSAIEVKIREEKVDETLETVEEERRQYEELLPKLNEAKNLLEQYRKASDVLASIPKDGLRATYFLNLLEKEDYFSLRIGFPSPGGPVSEVLKAEVSDALKKKDLLDDPEFRQVGQLGGYTARIRRAKGRGFGGARTIMHNVGKKLSDKGTKLEKMGIKIEVIEHY